MAIQTEQSERRNRKPGAPPGNRNAAKGSQRGLSLSLYLDGAEADVLTALLAERGGEVTGAAVRDLARELLHRAIRDVAQAQDRNAAVIL